MHSNEVTSEAIGIIRLFGKEPSEDKSKFETLKSILDSYGNYCFNKGWQEGYDKAIDK